MSARIKSEALADKAVRAPVRRGFMVPMRDAGIVEAFHEPSLRPRPRSRTRPRPANLGSRTRTRTRTIGFVVPMRDSGIVGAFHEPSRRSSQRPPHVVILLAF